MTDDQNDKVHVLPTADNGLVLARDGYGAVTLEEGHVVNLAAQLQMIVGRILRERSASKSMTHVPLTHLELAKFGVNHDLMGLIVLLQMIDTNGTEAHYGMKPIHARMLASKLVEFAEKAERVQRRSSSSKQ